MDTSRFEVDLNGLSFVLGCHLVRLEDCTHEVSEHATRVVPRVQLVFEPRVQVVEDEEADLLIRCVISDNLLVLALAVCSLVNWDEVLAVGTLGALVSS